jgi:hypothetical protein
LRFCFWSLRVAQTPRGILAHLDLRLTPAAQGIVANPLRGFAYGVLRCKTPRLDTSRDHIHLRLCRRCQPRKGLKGCRPAGASSHGA